MTAFSQSQISTLAEITSNGQANFWAGYSYVLSIVDQMPDTSDLQYWLRKAIEINSNSYDSEANTFIREVTRAGLLFDGKTVFDLQHNSDVIGHAVIGDILKNGTIASVPELIRADVEAALEEGGQTIGGWGGAFYYWNLILGDGQTVGYHIQNNIIDFDKFIAATAKATADTIAKLGISVEQFISASNAQVPLSVMTLILDRMLDTLSGGAPSFAGDPENIDGYRPIHGPDDVVVGWKYNTADQIGIPVTDSDLIAKLNIRYKYRADLSDSEAFAAPNPDLGLHVTGGLLAMKSDANALLNMNTGAPNSFVGSDLGQKDLAKLATWYANRKALIEAAGAKGVLDLKSTAPGFLQIDFAAGLDAAIEYKGSNTAGQSLTLFEEQKLVPHLYAVSAVYDALTSAQGQGPNMTTILDSAIEMEWSGTGDARHIAASQLEYFAFEAANGAGVTLEAKPDASSALVGGSGDDHVTGGSANDILIGLDGDDELAGGDGSDIILGGTGEDTIVGGHGSDYIDGGSGNDVIYGGEAATAEGEDRDNDFIVAGDGDDIVLIAGGSDVVSLGDGDDEVHISSSGSGVPARAVIWGGEGADSFYFDSGARVLAINVNGMTEELLQNLSTDALFDYLNTESRYDYIIINPDKEDKIFFQGTQLTSASVTNKDIIQDELHDFFEYKVTRTDPYNGEVQELFAHGYLPDGWEINEATAIADWVQKDTIRSFKMAASGSFIELGSGSYGAAFSLIGNDGKAFTFDGFSDGLAGINITGNASSILTETMTSSRDIVVNQVIEIKYIRNFDPDSPFFDPDHHPRYSLQYYLPYKYEMVGEPVITFTTEEDDIMLKPDGFDNASTPTIDITKFVVVPVNGTSGDDTLIGDARSQRFRGGEGNDTVDYSASSSGVSVDLDEGGTRGNASGDLYISMENVVGTAFFDELVGNAAANILTAGEGNDYLYGGAGRDTLFGGLGDDYLDGEAGDDIVRGGAGADRLFESAGNDILDGGEGLDTVSLLGESITDYTFHRNSDNSVTMTSGTGTTSTLIDVELVTLFSNGWHEYSVDDLAPPVSTTPTIVGTSGDDHLTGTAGDDVFDSLGGSDYVNGGEGSDTYLYSHNDGDEYIDDEAGSTSDIDVLKMKDIAYGDVTFSRDSSSSNLVLTVNSTNHVVTLDEQYYAAGEGWGLEKIEFADGISVDLKHSDEVWSYKGSNGNDQIVGAIWGKQDMFQGGHGNDTLSGEAGSDTYVYSKGDGSDLIYDNAGFTVEQGNTDVLRFTDLNQADLTFARDGDNLKVTVSDTGETITVDRQFQSTEQDWGVEKIEFADGSSWDLQDIWDHVPAAQGQQSASLNVAASHTAANRSVSPVSDSDAHSADIIQFPTSAPSNHAGPELSIGFQELQHTASADESAPTADIISLEDFLHGMQTDDQATDLWFEPEPIGSVI